MTRRAIVLWPDPRLSQTCREVGAQEDVTELVTDMFETMYDAPGRGLAAPQVGEMIRLFVMDCGWKEGDMRPIVCINPVIVAVSQEVETGVEGCLSIPEVPVDVTRPERITLEYQDLMRQVQRVELSGFDAKCFQHEYDHLEGRVIFDHLDAETRAQSEGAFLKRFA